MPSATLANGTAVRVRGHHGTYVVAGLEVTGRYILRGGKGATRSLLFASAGAVTPIKPHKAIKPHK